MSAHNERLNKTRQSIQGDPVGRDPLFDFYAADVLEDLANANVSGVQPGGYFQRSGYGHLKTVKFDLEKANLTDKQLTAVSLVFYGGAKKKRAARAMSITSQALTDHLKAALKKIQMSLGA